MANTTAIATIRSHGPDYFIILGIIYRAKVMSLCRATNRTTLSGFDLIACRVFSSITARQ